MREKRIKQRQWRAVGSCRQPPAARILAEKKEGLREALGVRKKARTPYLWTKIAELAKL